MRPRSPQMKTLFAGQVLCAVVASVGCSPVVLEPTDRTTANTAEREAAGFGETITNSIGMRLVRLSRGRFRIGSDAEQRAEVMRRWPEWHEETGRLTIEQPAHEVTLSRDFYLGATEVTVGHFRRFVTATGYHTEAERDPEGGTGWSGGAQPIQRAPQFNWQNVGWDQTDNHPVTNVTWNDAIAFCEWLSEQESFEYRLPTEPEWEYACRAGTSTLYWHGNDPAALVEVANVADASIAQKRPDWITMPSSDGYAFTAPTARFKPNRWGLYDMHGNVWEWCSDWFGRAYYTQSAKEDPTGPDEGEQKVIRGGSWDYEVALLRSASRHRRRPSQRSFNVGFRVARTVLEP